jgi:hypothetical protein
LAWRLLDQVGLLERLDHAIFSLLSSKPSCLSTWRLTVTLPAKSARLATDVPSIAKLIAIGSKRQFDLGWAAETPPSMILG